MLGLLDLGILGVVLFVILCIILLPVILTFVVGIAFANMLGFSGLTWWAFIILFYIIISAIIGACAK